jgi:hypothetical protein
MNILIKTEIVTKYSLSNELYFIYLIRSYESWFGLWLT